MLLRVFIGIHYFAVEVITLIANGRTTSNAQHHEPTMLGPAVYRGKDTTDKTL